MEKIPEPQDNGAIETNESSDNSTPEIIANAAVGAAEITEPKNEEAIIANTGENVTPLPVGEQVASPADTAERATEDNRDLPEFGTPDPNGTIESGGNDAEYEKKVNGEIQKAIIGLFGEKIAKDAKDLEKNEFVYKCSEAVKVRVEDLIETLDVCTRAEDTLVVSADTDLIATLEAFDEAKRNPEDVVKKDDNEFGTQSLENLIDEKKRNFKARYRVPGVMHSMEANDESLPSIARGLDALADNLESALVNYYDSERNKAEVTEPEDATQSIAHMRSIVTRLGGEPGTKD